MKSTKVPTLSTGGTHVVIRKAKMRDTHVKKGANTDGPFEVLGSRKRHFWAKNFAQCFWILIARHVQLHAVSEKSIAGL